MGYNYQIIIEYDGSKFVGWQYQKNGTSIQEVLEKKLKKIFKKKVKVIGAGRTDAGVHAKGQSAHFLVEKKIENSRSFLNSINFFLKDYPISIIEVNRKRKMVFCSMKGKFIDIFVLQYNAFEDDRTTRKRTLPIKETIKRTSRLQINRFH